MPPSDELPTWQWYVLSIMLAGLSWWARRSHRGRTLSELREERDYSLVFATSAPISAAASVFALGVALWQTFA